MTGKKKITGSLEVSGSIVSIEKPLIVETKKVLWADLVALRDAGELIPGQQYRITDYVTTTTQASTQSAGHQFDIIVTADDVDKLNENARACLHEGDTYFANSKLEAWQLKYCLDNDTSRFAWADSVNGKGVIYRMIDEFNNDVPYDFKNIQFKRKLTDGALDLDSGIDTWVYTFTMSDLVEGKVVDMSLKQNTEYVDDDGEYKQCANNVIKEVILDYWPNGLSSIQLNDNVFLNIFDDNNNYLYYQCYNNTLSSGCYYNTFGNDCRYNTFGDNCHDNTFGDNCHDNTLGNNCSGNTFGNNCYSNTFSNNCYSNTFDDNCCSNTFGNVCHNNILDNRCLYNTFGNNCYFNTFGKYCRDNTFGNNCYCLQISDASLAPKRYIHVENGTRGASSANQLDLYDPAILNKDYQVTFKKSASGKYLMLWATDTGTMTGKVKDDNTDNTWEDIA